MTRERLSRLQRRILAWLRGRGRAPAGHHGAPSIRTWCGPGGAPQGQPQHLTQGLAAKGLVTITRTPGGKAEAVDVTTRGDTGLLRCSPRHNILYFSGE